MVATTSSSTEKHTSSGSDKPPHQRLSTTSLGHCLLVIFGLLSAAIYYQVYELSVHFDYYAPAIGRPIIDFLWWFAAAFAIYAIAAYVARRSKQDWRLVAVIFGFSILFRAILVFSTPIQEVDIYRYIWDGVVVSQGQSPFEYSPKEIKNAVQTSSDDPSLNKLAMTAGRDVGLNEVLNRIHFDDLPTVYPQTSQFVFAAAALTTPPNSPVETRLGVMKLWLIGFDLATLAIVMVTLQLCRLPVGLSLTYGWCPLLMKEVANSGHLDAIAVAISALTVLGLVWAVKRCRDTQSHREVDRSRSETRFTQWLNGALVLTSAGLAFGVGAKLFPVVLLPLVTFVAIANCGWRSIFVPAIVFCSLTAVLLWPMLPNGNNLEARYSAPPAPSIADAEIVRVDQATPQTKDRKSDPSAGMKKFLSEWEMNDLLFMVLVENLKPAKDFPENVSVACSVLPQDIREAIVKPFQQATGIEPRLAPFLVTRIITTAVYLLLAIGIAAWAASAHSPANANSLQQIVAAAFLTIAWFWFLSPTQNPWYWTWALPFLPFMKNRAWFLVSGLVMVYYLRFWLDYALPQQDVALKLSQYLSLQLGFDFGVNSLSGPSSIGVRFFDFVITWLEFTPVFLWLAAEATIRRLRRSAPT